MKNKFFICMAGTVLALAMINPGFSQKRNQSWSKVPLLSFEKVAPQFPAVSSGYINDISSKAIRDFIRRFDSTVGENWSKITNGYIAFFEKDNIRFKVYYDSKGYWDNTMRTYTEKYLPFDVRHAVKSTYYDFNIYHVTEIESHDQPLIYFIYLRKGEDETSFKTITYSAGEMEEVEPYNGKWREKSYSLF